MLDFVIFAVTAALGLLVILLCYTWRGSQGSRGSSSTITGDGSGASKTPVPGWDRKPADPESGDLAELSQHGSLHQYLLHLHDHGRKPIAVFWFGKQRVVSVCSPQLLKDTIKLTYRPKVLFTLFEPLIGSHSIQYANGLDWEERRKIMYPKLRDDSLVSYMPYFIEIAEETKKAWSLFSADKPQSLQELLFPMTIKGVVRTCLGDVFEGEEEIQQISTAYHQCWSEMEQRLHIGPPKPGSEREAMFNESRDKLKDIVTRVISSRKDGTDSTELPFIDALLQSAVPDEQIVSDVLSFMVGGMHTSGFLLVWTLHYLMIHPKVMEQLVTELKNSVGTDRHKKMKDYVFSDKTYLRHVLNETLRLSTLAPFAARYSDHDITAGGYLIPAGTPVIHALGVALKNETLWTCPHKFDPSQVATNALQSKGMGFSPFGIGRRKCPGYQFSYVEVGVFFTVLLQQFTLRPLEGEGVECGQVHGLVTAPDKQLHAYISPRHC